MGPEEPRDVIWMRPEHAATGRPAQRSRAEITAAAVTIADREGLEAVSMRRVATELGTGAASLYRYVENREDLLDLMIDATGAEYVFAAPTGDWLADLLDIGDQARAIMRRHPWLPSLLITRSVLRPNGLVLLEHVLQALAPHPPAWPPSWKPSPSLPPRPHCSCRASLVAAQPGAAQRGLPEPRPGYRPLSPARGTARTGLTSAGEPGRSGCRACRPLPRHPRAHPERPTDSLVATFGGQDSDCPPEGPAQTLNSSGWSRRARDSAISRSPSAWVLRSRMRSMWVFSPMYLETGAGGSSGFVPAGCEQTRHSHCGGGVAVQMNGTQV